MSFIYNIIEKKKKKSLSCLSGLTDSNLEYITTVQIRFPKKYIKVSFSILILRTFLKTNGGETESLILLFF